MANMSYCRFQNTLQDLRDCYNALIDDQELSDEELRAKNKLVELCQDIANNFGEDDGLDHDFNDGYPPE